MAYKLFTGKHAYTFRAQTARKPSLAMVRDYLRFSGINEHAMIENTRTGEQIKVTREDLANLDAQRVASQESRIEQLKTEIERGI